jgi:anion-transporting  ArsA/GET3 family ATPase
VKLLDLVREKKVLVCVGTGGVGKTTLSSVLGVIAAREGKKVLVLTVDPARRLATALGLADLKDRETRAPLENAGGEMFASVIEPKTVFDTFVTRHTSPEGAEKILSNRIYEKLSTSLNGSQEFTALERFYRAYETGDYDLIILDTPPASHALDFLDSAARLAALFHDSVVKWFIRPLESKGLINSLISRGTGLAFRALEKLTGSEFIKELVEFFISVYGLRDALVGRLEDIQGVLRSDATGFVLITAYDQTKLKLAQGLHATLERRGYSLDQVIINRGFPEIPLAEAEREAIDRPALAPVLDLYKKLGAFFEGHRRAVGDFRKTLKPEVEIHLIPDQDQDIGDMKGLGLLAEAMVSTHDS